MNITDAEEIMDATERDLDLAVNLINTRYVRADLPDRLTNVAAYQTITVDLPYQGPEADLYASMTKKAFGI